MSNDLVVLQDINPIEAFKDKGCDPILDKITQEVKSYVYDMSTEAGRKHIGSVAYKIARSKTTLDDLGKALVADKKKEMALVDAERKRVREYLDALKDEIRKPLTEFEEEIKRKEQELIAEAARKKQEEERLAFEKEQAENLAKYEAEQELARKNATPAQIAVNQKVEDMIAGMRALNPKPVANIIPPEIMGEKDITKTYTVDGFITIKGTLKVNARSKEHARELVWEHLEKNVIVNSPWQIDDLDTDIW